MKILTVAASFAVALAVATSAQATQFVTNGNFASLTNGLGQLSNDTEATDWTTNGYNFVLNVADVGSSGAYGYTSYWDAANGGANTWNGLAPNGTDNFLALDGDFGTSPVTQTITGLTVGQTYNLSFSYAFGQQYNWNGATSQGFIASFGGTTVLSTLNNAIAAHGFSGWQTYNGTVTATSTSEVLSFLAQSTPAIPPFTMLTDVSLTSVPEASTWAMMIVGLGTLGVLARRRRQALASA